MPQGERKKKKEHNIKSNLENMDIAGLKWTFSLHPHNSRARVHVFELLETRKMS